jgi:hypothetical protein
MAGFDIGGSDASSFGTMVLVKWIFNVLLLQKRLDNGD